MPESKKNSSVKVLYARDIKWILKYANGFTTKQHLRDMFKYHNISFAIKENNVITSIVVMMVGQGKHYVALLWTNGSYRAIRESMLYFRDLAQKSTVLFHSRNNIIKNHRSSVSGEKSGKIYYKMVV